MKPVYSLVLTFFAALILFSQGYSLVAGVSFIADNSTIVDGIIDGISTAPAVPEHLEDTDPEDIVTIDPFLLSAHQSKSAFATDYLQWAAALTCAFILALSQVLKESPQKLQLIRLRISPDDSLARQRKRLIWLRHRALLD